MNGLTVCFLNQDFLKDVYIPQGLTNFFLVYSLLGVKQEFVTRKSLAIIT